MHEALLNEDVLEHIFDYLGIAALMRCRRVCKRWKHVIKRLTPRRIGAATLFIPQETDQDLRLQRIRDFLHGSRVYPDIVLCLNNNAAYLDLKTLAYDEHGSGKMVPLIQAIWHMLPAASQILTMVGEGIVGEVLSSEADNQSQTPTEVEDTTKQQSEVNRDQKMLPMTLLDALPTDLDKQEPFGSLFIVLSATQAHGLRLRLASFHNNKETTNLLTKLVGLDSASACSHKPFTKAAKYADKMDKIAGVSLRHALGIVCLQKTRMWEDELEQQQQSSGTVHFDWLLCRALRKLTPSCSILGLRSLCELLLRPTNTDNYSLQATAVDSDTIECIIIESESKSSEVGIGASISKREGESVVPASVRYASTLPFNFSVLELADSVKSEAGVLEHLERLQSTSCVPKSKAALRTVALQLSCTYRAEKLFRGRPNLESSAFAHLFPATSLVGLYVRNGIYYFDSQTCESHGNSESENENENENESELRFHEMVSRDKWTLFITANF